MIVPVIHLKLVSGCARRDQEAAYLFVIDGDVVSPMTMTVTVSMVVAVAVTVAMAMMVMSPSCPHPKEIDGEPDTADPQQSVDSHQLWWIEAKRSVEVAHRRGYVRLPTLSVWPRR